MVQKGNSTAGSNQKRASPAADDIENGSLNAHSSKKQRRTHGPALKHATGKLFERFQETYNIRSGEQEFLGLCAYLCVLLQSNYPMATADLDGFVSLYRSFASQRLDFEFEQAATDRLCIPSYHQWFRDLPKPLQQFQHTVMSGDGLRAIWAEHPFAVVRCQRSLQCIASRRRLDERLRAD